MLYQQTTAEAVITACFIEWCVLYSLHVTVWNIFIQANPTAVLHLNRDSSLALSQWKAASGLFWIHSRNWSRAINKIKVEIYHWQGKMDQQEQNPHCFLSQPQLCAHTLLAHCHLSLSQALASSPTAPTRPGQHMPLPNIHLLPAGLPAYLKRACHWDPFRFLCTESCAHRWICVIVPSTLKRTHIM